MSWKYQMHLTMLNSIMDARQFKAVAVPLGKLDYCVIIRY